MTPEDRDALRKPFPADVVGQLPRVWCKPCGDAKKRGGGTCDKHTKRKCQVCRNNITEAHLHLDYVGHAETTDRFLSVDPGWSWEPMAFDADGLPKLDQFGGMWIKLTICDTTRLGYGAATDGKTGPDAVKETIGDALRNAGMRFGVALDLWGAKFKGDDDDQDSGETHGRGDADQWENAQPARPAQPAQPSREQLLDAGYKAIKDTADVKVLVLLADKVDGYALAETITTDDAAEMHTAINARTAELAGNVPTPPVAPSGPPIVDVQKGRMFSLFSDVGLKDRAKQMEFLRKVTNRPLESRNDLTADEAQTVIRALETQKRTTAGKANGQAVPA